MIQIQRLTGIRPGEVVTLRACDIQMTGRVWTYRPASHKTEHHDLEREAWFGPRAQKVLRLFLDREPRACLFSPADAESERQAERHAARRTPATCGNRPGPRGCGGWRPGNRYSVASYRKAIHRACVKAGVPKWNPNRIRHNMATSVRREHGIELSQAVLGHQLGSRVTEVYAETNRQKARDVIAMVG